MDLGTVLSVLFGAVFIASGALKLRDPRWPDAAVALGTPSGLVRFVAPFELFVGAWIVTGVQSGPALIVGCVMLVIFTALLMRVVGSASPPVCACFGGLTARPVSWRSIVRNIVLLGLGVMALALSG